MYWKSIMKCAYMYLYLRFLTFEDKKICEKIFRIPKYASYILKLWKEYIEIFNKWFEKYFSKYLFVQTVPKIEEGKYFVAHTKSAGKSYRRFTSYKDDNRQ